MKRSRRLVTTSGGIAPLSIIDDFERSDGDLGNGWSYTPGVWTISSGVAKTNPGDGGEILPNPGFEGSYSSGSWSRAPNYGVTGTPVTLSEETSIVHGGVSAQRILSDGLNDGIRADVVITPALGRLLNLSTWFYGIDTRGQTARATNPVETRTLSLPVASQGSWTRLISTHHIENLVGGVGVLYRNVGAGTAIVDDASWRLPNMSDLYAIRKAKKNMTLKIAFNMPGYNYSYCGGIIRAEKANDPQQGYVIYQSRGNSDVNLQIEIYKLVNGLHTTKIGTNTTAIYVAGASIQMDVNGTECKTYYNNVLVRTDTLTDYLDNEYAGLFSTHGENEFLYCEMGEYG